MVDASQKSDMAEVALINECKTNSFEELANSGGKRFEKLNFKLSAFLFAIFKDEEGAMTLMQDLQIMDEEVPG